jgi:hypothetical protein
MVAPRLHAKQKNRLRAVWKKTGEALTSFVSRRGPPVRLRSKGRPVSEVLALGQILEPPLQLGAVDQFEAGGQEGLDVDVGFNPRRKARRRGDDAFRRITLGCNDSDQCSHGIIGNEVTGCIGFDRAKNFKPADASLDCYHISTVSPPDLGVSVTSWNPSLLKAPAIISSHRSDGILKALDQSSPSSLTMLSHTAEADPTSKLRE